MQRLEGTITRLVCLKDKFIIANIVVAGAPDGAKPVTVKGTCDVVPTVGDHIGGFFQKKEHELHGTQYESKAGTIEVSPPATKTAIDIRCREILKDAKIRLTPTIKRWIDTCYATGDFWKAITTAPRPKEAEGARRIQQLVAELGKTQGRQRMKVTDPALKVKQFLCGLRLTWSDRMMEEITGYAPDCENPGLKPITAEDLVADPFLLVNMPSIRLKHIQEYLAALKALHIVDADTAAVGELLHGCFRAEQDSDSCMPLRGEAMESTVARLRDHPVFHRYLREYNGCLYRKVTYDDEVLVAEQLVEYRTEDPWVLLENAEAFAAIRALPNDCGGAIRPSDEQCQAVAEALNNRISLIIGGAGTGKTTTSRLLARTVLELYPDIRGNVLYLAPTGKAVERVKESITDIGLSTDDYIMTIHRFVGLVKKHDALTTAALERGGTDGRTEEGGPPVPVCVTNPAIVVLDESGMISLPVLAMFFRALAMLGHVKPHLVFMGDDAQLSPVGVGWPFLDMITSGIMPIVRLPKVHRQGHASPLLDAITQLRTCKPVTVTADETFEIRKLQFDATGLDAIREWLCAHRTGSTVIVPTADLGKELTPVVRDCLNPPAKEKALFTHTGEPLTYRFGDRVMQCKNNYARTVFNGSVGTVMDTRIRRGGDILAMGEEARSDDETVLHVRFDGRDNDFYYTIEEAEKELQMAYVITTHKAQGSEYDHVLIVMDRAISGFINRNLIYTAASRGKRSVAIFLKTAGIMSHWRSVARVPNTHLVKQILDQVTVTDEEAETETET